MIMFGRGDGKRNNTSKVAESANLYGIKTSRNDVVLVLLLTGK